MTACRLDSGPGIGGLGPAPIKPDTTATPWKAPEDEGGGGAELAALQGINGGIDHAGIDQGAADLPAKHPEDDETDGLQIAGDGWSVVGVETLISWRQPGCSGD